jgi:Bacterial type II and III secretion system protein
VRLARILGLLALVSAGLGVSDAGGPGALAQSNRQVKVVLEFQQQAQGSRQGVQGQGNVIVEQRRTGDPRVRGRGGLVVEDTTTRITRSSGLFTVVLDGGAGSIMMADDVPTPQLAYYYDYATGKGYVAQGVAWQRVGTALAVRPVILPGNQIRVTLTPVISYFTPAGGGTIEVVEAATQLIVPNGGRIQFGGSTGSLHAVTRQVLGYRNEQSSQDSALTVSASIQ